MSEKLINKYLTSKKKIFNNYAKLITRIIKIRPTNLWKNKKEFLEYYSSINEKYVEEFYFNEEIDEELLKKHFNFNYNSNVVLMNIFLSIIKYFVQTDKESYLENEKENLMLLSVILYISYSIDNIINPLSEFDYKEVLEKTLKIFKSINLLTVYDKKRKEVERIVNMIRVNYEKSKSFLNISECDISYNTFKGISSDNKYFLVDYHYYVKDIEKYKSEDVKHVFKNLGLEENLLLNSYELVSLTILKEIICKKKFIFVLPIVKNMFSKSIYMKKLEKMFFNMKLKNNIVFMVNYKDYLENKNLVNRFEKKYNIIINIEDDVNIDEQIINDKKIIADKKIIEKYKFLNYIEKNVSISLKEKELLNIK